MATILTCIFWYVTPCGRLKLFEIRCFLVAPTRKLCSRFFFPCPCQVFSSLAPRLYILTIPGVLYKPWLCCITIYSNLISGHFQFIFLVANFCFIVDLQHVQCHLAVNIFQRRFKLQITLVRPHALKPFHKQVTERRVKSNFPRQPV